MMTVLKSHIGAYVKTDNLALAPAAQAAGSRQGATFDPGRYGSGVLVAFTGAASGTPTSFSVVYEVETRDGSDNANAWSTLKDMDGEDVALTLTTASTAVELDIDFQYIPVGHDELRVVEAMAFVGGSTPTVVSGALLVLGGASTLPV